MFIYTPKKAYLAKMLFSVVMVFLLVFVCLYIPMFFIMKDEHVVNYQWKTLWISTAIDLVWAVPTFLVMFPLFKSYRYELMDDEIVVTSGYLVKKIKHVPYRMVTNLELKRGVIDRLLGIGTLSIETAGNSDPNQRPEAMLVGLSDVDAVYEEVAGCLRNFDQAQQQQPWERGSKKAAVGGEVEVLGEILTELKAIHQKIR